MLMKKNTFSGKKTKESKTYDPLLCIYKAFWVMHFRVNTFTSTDLTVSICSVKCLKSGWKVRTLQEIQ